MRIMKKSIIFIFYLLLGCFFGWILKYSESEPIFFGVYYLGLMFFGIIVGLIVKKMYFFSYLGIVLGQTFFLAGVSMILAAVFLFLHSIYYLFGNAIGAVIVENKLEKKLKRKKA